MRAVLMFPGQGSQCVGMHLAGDGTELDPATLDEANDALGMDLRRVLAEGPEELLARTEVTQPAILAASLAAWRHLQRKEPSLTVLGAAGHSLGEFSALVAAGSLTLADALRLVRLRGLAMQEAVPLGVGGMAAILGLDDATVAGLCAEHAHGEVVGLAGLNCPGQVAIAGHVGAVDRVVAASEPAGGVGKRLAVSAPFHSPLLAPAATRLAEALEDVPLRAPTFPVFHNVDGATAPDVATIRARLVAQVTLPVRWVDCARALSTLGAETAFECGPGRTLAGLQRRIDKSLPVRSASAA
jgi:[acyl-carrier-protein] S-malonyltransferase